MRTKITLVGYWRVLWRAWSLRLAAVATVIMSFGALFPGEAYAIYETLPDEIRVYIPPVVGNYIGIGLYMLSMLSQYIRQEKLVARLRDYQDE